MVTKVVDFIEVSGLSDSLPEKIENFQQLFISEILNIPASNPVVEDILRVGCDVEISSQKVISTPRAVSCEGKCLTGWKLLIEGFIYLNIEYAIKEKFKTIHALHFQVPFSTYIILPGEFSLDSQINVKGYIEDIKIKKLSQSKLFTNTLLLINADIIY